MTTEHKAPPIGIMPKWLHDEHRLLNLRAAVSRYQEDGLVVPQEWLEEMFALMDDKKHREDEAGRAPLKTGDRVVLVDDKHLCASDSPPALGRPVTIDSVSSSGRTLTIEGYGYNTQGCRTMFRTSRFRKVQP